MYKGIRDEMSDPTKPSIMLSNFATIKLNKYRVEVALLRSFTAMKNSKDVDAKKYERHKANFKKLWKIKQLLIKSN